MIALAPALVVLALAALTASPLPPQKPQTSAEAAATPALPGNVVPNSGAIRGAEAESRPRPSADEAGASPSLAPLAAGVPTFADPERLAREVADRLAQTDRKGGVATVAEAAPSEAGRAAPEAEPGAIAAAGAPAKAERDVGRLPLPRSIPEAGGQAPSSEAGAPSATAPAGNAPPAGTRDAAATRAPLPPVRKAGPQGTEQRQAPADGSGKIVLAALPLPSARGLPGGDAEGPQPDQFVCRDPRLAGAVIPAIGGPGSPCGIVNPVRLSAISGIVFDTPATLDCPTARRIAHWLTGVADPMARRDLGSRIVEVDVMGSYSCRTRNNRSGGRISEHGLGRALDVGGFRLADGRRISVSEDWRNDSAGAFLRDLHKHSCGLFTTVLGPDADRYHHDHLHLDNAQREGTPYCR